jgi:hypothetical protein
MVADERLRGALLVDLREAEERVQEALRTGDGPAPADGPSERGSPGRRLECASAMRDLDLLFSRLAESSFRQGFRLRGPELEYLRQKGLSTVLEHAGKFIEQRLAPALPAKDGKQTPYRGHPVFVAQHATATCCRGCLEKWHSIPRGRPLTEKEREHVLATLERWLRMQSA